MTTTQIAIAFYATCMVLGAVIITCSYSHIKVFMYEKMLHRNGYKPVSTLSWQVLSFSSCLITVITPVLNTWLVIAAIVSIARSASKK